MFVERYELQPIDRQTNGPQLFYGLRYHTHIVKPGEVETFHDQVGYWLWEPAARTIVHTLAIPRGQVLLAAGIAEPNATEFEVSAALGRRRVRHPVEYEEHTALRIHDRQGLVDHVDRNRLRRIAQPTPNPLATVPDGRRGA